MLKVTQKSMNKFAFLLILTAAMSSCINQDEEKAINAVQGIVQAENIAVGSGFYFDTNNDEINYKTLAITSGENLNDPEIPDEYITSISALTFYQNLSGSTLEGKDAIKVVLERYINGNIKTVESLYSKDTLEMVNRTIGDCKRLAEAFISNDYKVAYEQLNEKFKKNVSLSDFDADMRKLDEEIGSTDSYIIKGFKITKLTKSDGLKFPVVHFWVTLNRDSIANDLDIDYSLDPNIKGVLNLDL